MMALIFVLSGLFLFATEYGGLGLAMIIVGICMGLAAPDRGDY